MNHIKISNMKTLLLGAALLCAGTGVAMAGPGKISSPYVTKDKFAIENVTTYALDYDEARDDLKTSLKIEYGFTDEFKAEIQGKYRDRAGSAGECTGTKIGGVMEITTDGEYVLDSAIKAAYEFNDDRDAADSAELELRLARKIKDTQTHLNTTLSGEVGSDRESDTELDIEAGAYRKYGDWTLGMEYFADIGELSAQSGYSGQGHYIGPRAGTKIALPETGGALSLKFGYVHGISKSAADGVFKTVATLSF